MANNGDHDHAGGNEMNNVVANNDPIERSGEYQEARRVALELNLQELGALIADLQQQLENRQAMEAIRQAREQFLTRMREHAWEFALWSRKRDAYIARMRGQNANTSEDDDDEDAGVWHRHGSDTESGSESEGEGNHPDEEEEETDSEDEDARVQRRKEKLFRIYWREKTEFPRVFARTMNEVLPGEEILVESSEELENEDADEESDEEEQNGLYGSATSDSDMADPVEEYPDEMDDSDDDAGDDY